MNSAVIDRLGWMTFPGRQPPACRIMAPGFKYNLTDIAAAIGINQLAKAEEMRLERESIAHQYLLEMAGLEEIELPPVDLDRIHAWHLFPVKLRLESLSIDRNAFIDYLKDAGVACSVHWRPLHLHPYYEQTFGWASSDFPVATAEWQRIISLPIFPGMSKDEIRHVIQTVQNACAQHSNSKQLITV